MKYFLSLLLACIFCLAHSQAFASDRQIAGQEAESLLARIKQNQANLKTMTGSFSEERTICTMPVPLVFTGKVYAAPPEFLFLAYEMPIQHIMKVSGDSVIFYVAGSNTADIVNLQTAGEGGHPPELFNWDPTDFAGVIIETDTGYVFHNPEVKAGDRQIKITLNKQTLMIQSLILQEPGGDITTINMENLQINGVIPDAILNYQLPAGTTINKMGQ